MTTEELTIELGGMGRQAYLSLRCAGRTPAEAEAEALQWAAQAAYTVTDNCHLAHKAAYDYVLSALRLGIHQQMESEE